jgi:hypothetical protein
VPSDTTSMLRFITSLRHTSLPRVVGFLTHTES